MSVEGQKGFRHVRMRREREKRERKDIPNKEKTSPTEEGVGGE